MGIILRYVDLKGFVRERVFQVMSLTDTNSSTLQKEICNVLTRYNLSVENLRDCPSAYYIYCFAHRFQLALIAVAKDVHDIWLFFLKLNSIINFVSASFKRHSQPLLGLIKFTLCNDLELLVGALILLLLILGISDILCQALQLKSQEILNAMSLVSSTKMLLLDVMSFFKKYEIDMPDMNARHMEGTKRSCQQKDNITVEHYFHFNIFNAVIDFQMMELTNRFP
ncbi:hypothetical protein ACOSP7_021430 [Xanthoceras sorbifolium]